MGRRRSNILEIAIEGAGIAPRDVSIDHLSELLSAMVDTLIAISAESGLPRVLPSLRKVKEGSAAYELASDEPTWPRTVDRLYAAVETRGKKSSARVRYGLSRLFRAARVGALKLGRGETARPRLTLSAPLEPEESTFADSRTLYGRIVGVNEFERGGWKVRLALTDGGRLDIKTTEPMAQQAARLFSRPIRANVVFGPDSPEELREIDPWSETDFVAAMEDVRRSLSRDGITVPTREWLDELEQ